MQLRSLPGVIGALDNPNAQIVLQAAALAVQDSMTYFRSMEALATAVTGVSLNGMLRAGGEREMDQYSSTIYLASIAVDKACKHFAEVSKVAERVLHGGRDGPTVVREIETELVTAIDDNGNKVVTKRTIRRVFREQ